MLILNLVLSLGMFASTAWAVQRFFSRPDGRVESEMLWLRRLVIGSTMLQLLDLLRSPLADSPARGGLAASLYVVGLALFWSATFAHRRRPPSLAYSVDAPQHLVEDGPYALIRHPFYTAYMFGWTAGYVASGIWTSVVPLIGLFVFYDRSARLEEQKFAVSPLAEEYARYKARTGRYLPNPWKLWRAIPSRAVARAGSDRD